ncbi:MAG TPA: FISUMP domain-containing protein [Candidatus Absconditabacterales bacterium]|nr:FISUMP domain-containing protein [Candidatus Absconditabacterales bacterium]HPK28050.1 FISUMP domain-containing protein [Candidatus Absconditabacterales bacterium]
MNKKTKKILGMLGLILLGTILGICFIKGKKGEEVGGIIIDQSSTIATITISDGNNTFVIMDRNLGALEAGTGPNSYGYYYQRGNNHGFSNTGNLDKMSNLKPDISAYGPKTFSGYYNDDTFILAGPDWSIIPNYNLRGGHLKDNLSSIPIGIDAQNRQGPCPDGFHVPSIGEWNQLFLTWGKLNGLPSNYKDYKKFFSNKKAIKFSNDFLLPLAGCRNYMSRAMVYAQGRSALYWSSSPAVHNAYLMFFDSSEVSTSIKCRAGAFSVRCFKNIQEEDK